MVFPFDFRWMPAQLNIKYLGRLCLRGGEYILPQSGDILFLSSDKYVPLVLYEKILPSPSSLAQLKTPHVSTPQTPQRCVVTEFHLIQLYCKVFKFIHDTMVRATFMSGKQAQGVGHAYCGYLAA